MGGAGRVVGLFFFVTLAVGALTSAISLLEVVTASVMDEFGVARRKAAIGTGAVITALGILPALSTDTLGLMDKIAGELLLRGRRAGDGHPGRLAGPCARSKRN